MSRRRKGGDRSPHGGRPVTPPQGLTSGHTSGGAPVPRRPYAGPGGRGQVGREHDGRRRHSLQEDTSPSRYTRAQRHAPRGRRPRLPRPPQQNRPAPPRVAPGTTIDPFELFCAYHLGITDAGAYRIQNIHEVARRFGTNAGALKQTLVAYGMGADDIVHSGFDLAGAQLDIMVAPEGVSRRELARPLYEEFKQAPRSGRNWARELEEAEREIARTIGADGRWSPGPRDAGGKQ